MAPVVPGAVSANKKEIYTIKVGAINYGFQGTTEIYESLKTELGLGNAGYDLVVPLRRIPHVKLRVRYKDGAKEKNGVVACDPGKVEAALTALKSGKYRGKDIISATVKNN